MVEIRIPTLNANDSEYVLLEWAIADGQSVHADDVIATVETSKTAEELVCEYTGVLRHIAAVGDRCAPGDVIGRILEIDSVEAPQPPGNRATDAAPNGEFDVVITEPAKKLMDELGVSAAAVRGLGKRLIREADVRHLAAPQREATAQALPPAQRAVAKTVICSHQTIPAAYTAINVDVDAALKESRRLADLLHQLVGLPELLVAAVSSLHSSFPFFFASLIDEDTVRFAEQPCVGVTFDIGRGLVVPVVKDAARLTVPQLAEVLGRYRRAAISGALQQRDLTGGNITVTLHNEPDISLAIPIVFPGQACALALAGTRTELSLGAGSKITQRTTVNIGLAYDHRLINGRDAIQFLRAVKRILETPTLVTQEATEKA